MKAVIKFDFDGEHGAEDQSRFNMMMKSQDLFFALNEFDNYLRSLYKHQNTETIGTWDARQKLHEILGGRNISLDELL